jgi:Flp pilus assembly protein TadG
MALGPFNPRKPAGLAARLKRFSYADSGVAAVEFALILPVMVLIYFGMVELTIGINTHRKLALLTRSLADLSSRTATMTDTAIGNVFNAARAVMQPYDATNVAMTVTSVVVTNVSGTVTGKVDWSCRTANSIVRAPQSSYTVPDGFKDAQSFILIETALDYFPMFGGRFIGQAGSLHFVQTTPWPVRDAPQVVWSGTTCGVR